MTQPVGYYTGYNPQTHSPDTLHLLQERFGSQLEGMTYEQKIVFRAALAGFIASTPVWIEEGSSITCIDGCIESAGVDWNVWDKDQELCEWITDCSKLSESDIEGLIEALTAQIRGKVYASDAGIAFWNYPVMGQSTGEMVINLVWILASIFGTEAMINLFFNALAPIKPQVEVLPN